MMMTANHFFSCAQMTKKKLIVFPLAKQVRQSVRVHQKVFARLTINHSAEFGTQLHPKQTKVVNVLHIRHLQLILNPTQQCLYIKKWVSGF